MFKAWVGKFDKKVLYTLAVLSVTATALLFAATYNSTTADAQIKGGDGGKATNVAPSATFNGGNLGPIADLASGCQPTQGTPRNVTFNVTGLSAPPTDVNVSVTFGSPNHTWAGDVTATLIAPNGTSHTVFGRVLATTATGAGDSSDLGGVYTFDDQNAAPPSGGFWQAATAEATGAAPIAAGDYRTTGSGGAGATNPMPPTSLNTAFAGIPTSNGTWTLRLTDGCAGDTGAVTAASLTIEAGPVVAPDANVDFDGDGKTDYVVARGTTTPFAEGAEAERAASEIVNRPRSDMEEREVKGRRRSAAESVLAPPIYWYSKLSGSGATGVGQLGDAATDFITPEDFDGDGKDDLAVWTEAPANSANFKILQSSTNTVRVVTFGQTGDDPAIIGDYDGDGKADPAVYRCPAFGGADGQCFFFYLGSNANPSGNITYVPWGFGVDGDYFPLVGDFDGDGKHDFCVQTANPSAPTQGKFWLLKSTGGVEQINWGLSSDFLIPGDYDGDGKADFCVRRLISSQRQHFILTRTGATSQVAWGIAGDISAPGDYDGDGKTDLAIWRPNVNPDQNFFWVLNSSNGSVTQFEWGQCPTGACDSAVATWAVH